MKISLKAARINAGFTLTEAAAYLGIHSQTLSKYEKNSSDIPISLLNKISELYGIALDYIFLGKEFELIRILKTKHSV